MSPAKLKPKGKKARFCAGKSDYQMRSYGTMGESFRHESFLETNGANFQQSDIFTIIAHQQHQSKRRTIV